MEYTQKKDALYAIFDKYQKKEISEAFLIKNLQDICKGKGRKAYWWRWFEGDALVSDWMTVRASLNSIKNTAHLNECINIALKNKSFIVYYS